MSWLFHALVAKVLVLCEGMSFFLANAIATIAKTTTKTSTNHEGIFGDEAVGIKLPFASAAKLMVT